MTTPYFAFRCCMASGRAIILRAIFQERPSIAKHFLTVAEKQTRSAPLLMAHRVMGATLAISGEFQAARSHLQIALLLFDLRNLRAIAAEPAACPTLTRGRYTYDFINSAHMSPLAKMYSLGSNFMPPIFHAGGPAGITARRPS